MPSESLRRWREERLPSFAQIEAAHAGIVGVGPGRRYTTQQVNQAFVMLLSSQFQGFCRDLYSECVDAFCISMPNANAEDALRTLLTQGRKLETGNPNPGNLGSDFGRFGIELWPAIRADHADNERRRTELERLNAWRNAIGHQDFNKPDLQGRTTISFAQVRSWRAVCRGLAKSLDRVMRAHLSALTGGNPW